MWWWCMYGLGFCRKGTKKDTVLFLIFRRSQSHNIRCCSWSSTILYWHFIFCSFEVGVFFSPPTLLTHPNFSHKHAWWYIYNSLYFFSVHLRLAIQKFCSAVETWKMSDRVSQIDSRLAQIEIEKQATQNEQLLILLAQERLALTNERISLTSPAPAPAPGNYPSCEFHWAISIAYFT